MAEYEGGGVLNQPESLSVNPREEELPNGIVRQVFGNSLIVQLMCSFVSSKADIRNLRLVNHTFQSEATKKLRQVNKEIALNSEPRIQTLVDWTKSRDALNLTPFPFTSFNVSLTLSLETLETFGKTVGPHVTRYSFQLRSYLKAEHPRNTDKVVTLLSHSTELVALEILSHLELLLTKEDLDRFPSAYRHLSNLGISGSQLNKKPKTETVTVFPLVDLLVIRAPHLQKVNISPYNPSQINRILRLLVQNRPKNLPHFSLDANPYCSSFFGKVMDMNLTFTDLTIPKFNLDKEQVIGMIRRLCTWLETQTNSLINLSINIFSYEDQEQVSLRFPELQVLLHLLLTFPYSVSSYSRCIQPFVGNPFPSLRKLCLEHYREEFALFGTCSMPSVQELHLRKQRSSFSDPSWSKRFPNLTTLHIEFYQNLSKVFRSMLRYILIHLTQLEHLDLDIDNADVPNASWCNWDLLTGGAPESFRQLILSAQKLPDNVGAKEEHVNGIYRVPSLSNMKNLKTLRIFPRLKSNLDAIVYMSRTGLLGPLQKLVLYSLPDDNVPRMTDLEETAAYKEVLLSVHKEVVLWKSGSRCGCQCRQYLSADTWK